MMPVQSVAARPVRAVVVADIDLLDGRIFGLRSRPDEVFGLDFDNVEFALNLLDSLAGDEHWTAGIPWHLETEVGQTSASRDPESACVHPSSGIKKAWH